MTRQSRTALVLGVAVVTATAATYGVYRAISRIPVRTVEIATNHAVVAAKALPNGAMLKADDVKLIDWPAKSPLANGFSEVDKVVDRGLIWAVVENEPIVESKLAPIGAGAGLPPSIPAGMRAMSVKVNEVIGVAGFVVPGNRVDVMVTIKQQNNDSITKTVVSNVQVLTAGTRYDQQNEKASKPIPSTVITLLVSPQDGEKITLAQSEGQLMLALRNPLDVEPTVTSGARTSNLLGAPASAASSSPKGPVRRAAAPVVQAPAPPPPPSAYTVEAIRAAKRTEEVVR
jgi:pilus assembly protein CpaB